MGLLTDIVSEIETAPEPNGLSSNKRKKGLLSDIVSEIETAPSISPSIQDLMYKLERTGGLPPQQAVLQDPSSPSAYMPPEMLKPPSDDIDRKRGFIESVKESYRRGEQNVDMDIAVYEAAIEGKGNIQDVLRIRNKRAQKLADDPVEGNFISELVYGAAEILPGMLGGYKSALPYAATGAVAGATGALVAGQAGPQLLTPEEAVTVPGAAVIGGVTGLHVGSTQYWYKQGAGAMLGNMLDKGYNPDTSKIVSQIAGVPYALIEMSQVKRLAPGLRKGAQEVLQKSIIRVFGRAAKKYGKTLTVEVLEEIAQEAVSVSAEDLAGYLSDKGQSIDKEYFKDRALRLWQTGIQATKGMALLPIPGAIVDIVTRTRESQTATGFLRPDVKEKVELEPTIPPKAAETPQAAPESTLEQKTGKTTIKPAAGENAVDKSGVYYRSEGEDVRTGGLINLTKDKDVAAMYELGGTLDTEEEFFEYYESDQREKDLAAVKEYVVDAKNTLNIDEKGLYVISKLDSRGNSQAKRIIEDSRKGNLIYWWQNTKPHTQEAWEKVLIPQLRELGYDSISFRDDVAAGTTLAVFDRKQLAEAKPDTAETTIKPAAEPTEAKEAIEPTVKESLTTEKPPIPALEPSVTATAKAGKVGAKKLLLKKVSISSIKTPLQGQLAETKERKAKTFKQLKQLREKLKEEPLGGNRAGIRLDILNAEEKHRKAVADEKETIAQIEKEANRLGKTIVKPAKKPIVPHETPESVEKEKIRFTNVPEGLTERQWFSFGPSDIRLRKGEKFIAKKRKRRFWSPEWVAQFRRIPTNATSVIDKVKEITDEVFPITGKLGKQVLVPKEALKRIESKGFDVEGEIDKADQLAKKAKAERETLLRTTLTRGRIETELRRVFNLPKAKTTELIQAAKASDNEEYIIWSELLRDMKHNKKFHIVNPNELPEGTKIKLGEHTFIVQREEDPFTGKEVTLLANDVTVSAEDITRVPAEKVIKPKKIQPDAGEGAIPGQQLGLLGREARGGYGTQQGQLAFEEPSAIAKEIEKIAISEVEGQKKLFRKEGGFAAVPTPKELHALVSMPGAVVKWIPSVVGKIPGLAQSTTRLSHLAPKWGKITGQSFHDISDRKAELAGKWHDEVFESLRKLTRKEHENYRKAIRGNEKPMNKAVETAIKETLAVSDRMGALGEEVGLPVYGKEEEGKFKKKRNYYPLIWSSETDKSVQKESGPIYEDMVNWIAEDMQKRHIEYVTKELRAKTKNWSVKSYKKQAKRFLADRRKYSYAGRELTELYHRLKGAEIPGDKIKSKIAKWQYHRAFEYPDRFLEENPNKVWENHIHSFARRIAEAEIWGPQSERLLKWVRAGVSEAKKLAKQKQKSQEDAQVDFLRLTSHLVGYESNIEGLQSDVGRGAKKAMRTARLVTGGIHLFNVSAPARNTIWGQMVSMTHFGLLRPHAQFLRTIFSRKRIRAVRRAGALEHTGIDYLLAKGVAPATIERVLRAPMGAAEVMVRTTAAYTGSGVWTRAIKKAHEKGKTPGWLIRDLTRRDVGFSVSEVESMVNRGIVSEKQRNKMMRGAVNITQFQASAKDIPASWGTEGGRFWTQFWAMAYKQTQNTVGYALDEAGYGNYIPLARFIVAAMFAGWSIDVIWNFFSGKQPDKKDLDKMDKYLRWVGNAMGFIEVPLQLFTSSRAEVIARRVTPASVNTAANIVAAANKALKYAISEEAATRPQQKKRAKSVIRSLAKQTGAGRDIYGQVQKAKQSRGQLTSIIEPQKKDTADYYRRKMTNLLREKSSLNELVKFQDWGKKHGVNIRKENKQAKATVRREKYDELYVLWKRAKAAVRTEKYAKKKSEYDDLRKWMKEKLSATDEYMNRALRSRRDKDKEY